MFEEVAQFLIQKSLAATRRISKIDEKIHTPTGITNKRLNAVFGTRGLSDMLLYRKFKKISEKDEFGVYEMADGRRGFIIQITPPPYIGNGTQEIFKGAIPELAKEGHVVQISTYASRNLDNEISRWQEIHHGNTKVDNPRILKEWARMRGNTYRKWTKSSMMRNMDIRLRNFVTIISVLAPYGATDSDLINLYRTSITSFIKFDPRCFYPEDLMRMTNEIFKPRKESWEPTYDDNINLNVQMGFGTSINVLDEDRDKGILTIDSKVKMKALTTVKMPKKLSMFQFQRLFYDIYGKEARIPVPSPYLVSMTIAAKDVEKNSNKAATKAAKDRAMLRKIGIKEEDKNPLFADRFHEGSETITGVKKHSERLFSTMYEIFVFEEDEADLDRHCKALIDRFKLAEEGGWILEAEKQPVLALSLLLYSMPLMYLDYMKEHILKHRFSQRWTSNNATIAPVVSDSKGVGDFGNIYVGRTGQMIRIDYSVANNQNIIIIGPPGSGKSYLLNDIIMSCSASAYVIRSLDLGNSAKYVCEYQGGKHIDFDMKNDLCMNFFTHINEKEGEYYDSDKDRVVFGKMIHPEEFSTIIPMIGLMVNQDLKSPAHHSASDNALRHELSTYIQVAVEMAYRRHGKSAGMKDVSDELKAIRTSIIEEKRPTDKIDILINGLHNYANKNGAYYRYFNGPNNIDTSNYNLAVYEFEKLRYMNDFLYVAQAAIMQRIAQEFFIMPKETPKLFTLDEAKTMAINNPIMVGYLEDFSLRLRKHNTIFVLATQSATHFYTADPRAESIYSVASWKIYMKHSDEASLYEAVEKGALAKKDEFSVNMIKSLQFIPSDYAEFFIMSPLGKMVCRLKVDTFSNWLYTTNPKDFQKIAAAQEKYNLERDEALFYLAQIDDGKTHQEALQYANNNCGKSSGIITGNSVGVA